MKTIKAWHFVGATLRNGDPVPPDGEWLEYAGQLVMCKSGLHASRHPFDALQHAPGPILCRVECSGVVIEGANKLVCSRRRIVARRDATDGLRYFARMRAVSVVDLWEPPDVVLNFLMTGDNTASAAANYAAAAANYAAAAANYAAYSTAYSAASAAANYAAAANAAYATNAAYAAAAYVANPANAAYAAAANAANAAAAAKAGRAEWHSLVSEAFNGEGK